MLTSTPTALQVPGPVSIAAVNDDRGYTFTASITRPAPTVTVPLPNWAITLTISVATPPATIPTNTLHRVPLLQNASITVFGDIVPDIIALNVYLLALYNDLANLLMPPNV